jgi:hypothetical protein
VSIIARFMDSLLSGGDCEAAIGMGYEEPCDDPLSLSRFRISCSRGALSGELHPAAICEPMSFGKMPDAFTANLWHY